MRGGPATSEVAQHNQRREKARIFSIFVIVSEACVARSLCVCHAHRSQPTLKRESAEQDSPLITGVCVRADRSRAHHLIFYCDVRPREAGKARQRGRRVGARPQVGASGGGGGGGGARARRQGRPPAEAAPREARGVEHVHAAAAGLSGHGAIG